MKWISSIFSEVNSQFVSNPYPQIGEEFTISLRVSVKSPVTAVFLRSMEQGISDKTAMTVSRCGDSFAYYSFQICIGGSKLQYSFELETPEGYYFYTRNGVTRIHQTEDYDFVILAGLDYPEWVPGAVFYQIFPDRFKNGDKTAGVRTDEYMFDGHMTRELDWDEAPPEYEEGHCLDFYNGDLSGIQDSIPYLRDLGVTALYLNPIFSASTNHRYDCNDFFQVDEHLGGDRALEKLMTSLHDSGMFCILDVSINHLGINHPWFLKALQNPDSPEAQYFYREEDGSGNGNGRSQYVCWFDIPTLPQLNYRNEELRDIIWRADNSMIRKFLHSPYSLDGWRFDVANQVGRYKDDQFCHEIWREIRKIVKDENSRSYIIGEHWEDHIDYVLGDQWDGAMNYFGSGRLLRGWIGERDRYLTDGWGHNPQPGRKITGNELGAALTAHLARIPNQLVFREFNLIDSHDTPRLHNNSTVFDWEIYRGVIMMLFMLPGPVSYFYGDEVGIDGHVRSVEGSRYPMQWDPQKQDSEFLGLYRTLGRLKSSEPALADGGWKILLTLNDLFVFSRFFCETGFIMILNREADSRAVHIPIEDIGAVEAVEVFSGVPGRISDGTLHVWLDACQSMLFKCRLLD